MLQVFVRSRRCRRRKLATQTLAVGSPITPRQWHAKTRHCHVKSRGLVACCLQQHLLPRQILQ